MASKRCFESEYLNESLLMVVFKNGEKLSDMRRLYNMLNFYLDSGKLKKVIFDLTDLNKIADLFMAAIVKFALYLKEKKVKVYVCMERDCIKDKWLFNVGKRLKCYSRNDTVIKKILSECGKD